MNIDANKIGISSAVTFSIVWLICSLVVYLAPQLMMSITGHMMHAEMGQNTWTLTLPSVLIGLIAWAGLSGITGWLIATIHNKL